MPCRPNSSTQRRKAASGRDHTISRFGARFHQSAQVNLLPIQRKDAKAQRLEILADVVSPNSGALQNHSPTKLLAQPIFAPVRARL